MTAPDLGLPPGVRACLFDLDGVLTDTASVHTRAWKQAFDAVLLPRGQRAFTLADYAAHVDGKPRDAGTRDLLRSRGLDLPEGSPDDPPGTETVAGISRAKNDLVLALIERDGVEVFPASRDYVVRAREAGLAVAVVSSSANTQAVLETTGLDALVDLRVDALVAREHGLPGKPAPDTYLFAGRQLGCGPAECAVFEDALSGVAAGRAGGFALVVGVDRADQAAALREAGADVVVRELSELGAAA